MDRYDIDKGGVRYLHDEGDFVLHADAKKEIYRLCVLVNAEMADAQKWEQVACGWAFNAGMREAERDRARAFYERMISRDIEQRKEIAALKAKLDEASRSNDYACETPLAGCDCPGCSLARDESGAPAPREG
jgi:hypothetical protein